MKSLGARSVLRARKYVYQNLKLGSREPKTIVFIFGCQRSGTTLLQHIFDSDLNAGVYGEFDRRVYAENDQAGGGRHFRLKPLRAVHEVVSRDRARLVVVKPIIETQNAARLLAFFPGSKALFLYRNYAAVAASNLKLFGRMNGINDLRPLVNGETANWRAEGVPLDVRSLVAARFHDNMNPYDAAALFWYVRNRFFFDLGLDRLPAVKPFRYEDLVRDPDGMMRRIYRFVGMDSPPASGALVRNEPAAKGKDVKLSPDVDELCRDLLCRLDRSFAGAWTNA